jgi:hypothetical protein
MNMPISMRRRMYFLLSRYLERDAAVQNKKPAPPIEDEDRQQWTVNQFEALKQAFNKQDALSGQRPPSPSASVMEVPSIVKDYRDQMKKRRPQQEKEEKKASVKSMVPPKQVPKGLAVPTVKIPDVSRLDPKFVEAWERQREANPHLPSLDDLAAQTKKDEEAKKPTTKSVMSEPKILRDIDDQLIEKTVIPKRKAVPDALKDLLEKQKEERRKR